jgi:hypothetical protein
VVVVGFQFEPSQTPVNARLVQVFDNEGNFLFDWGVLSIGPEPGKLMSLMGIGLGPDGTILVTEGGTSTIEQFTGDGRYIDTLAGFGDADGQFFHLKDVAVDEQGRIYATDWGKNLVTVLDRDGRYLASWGEKGTEAGQFRFPYGVAPTVRATSTSPTTTDGSRSSACCRSPNRPPRRPHRDLHSAEEQLETEEREKPKYRRKADRRRGRCSASSSSPCYSC